MESLINTYSAKTVWMMALNASWGSFIFGYNIGVMSALEGCLAAYFDWGSNEDFYFNLFMPAMHLGATFGALFAGSISERVGRRRALIVHDIVILVGCALVALPYLPFYPIGRFICGYGAGGFASVVPNYLREITPAEVYGRVGALVQLQVTLGIAVSYGWALALPTSDYGSNPMTNFWVFIYLFQGLLALMQMLFFLSLYKNESPVWLMMKGYQEDALVALQEIYVGEEAGAVLKRIEADVAPASIKMSESTSSLLVEPSYKELLCCKSGTGKMMRMGILVNIFQQTIGINAILGYAAVIFESLGASVFISRLLTFVAGLVNMLSSLLIFPLVGRFGRKTLMIVGNSGIVLCMIGVAIFSQFAAEVTHIPSIILILIYLVYFEIGIGPLCWVFCGDFLNSEAISICAAVNWLANFATVVAFPYLVQALGYPLTFGVYGVIATLSVLYFVLDLIETKGLTSAQINKLIRK